MKAITERVSRESMSSRLGETHGSALVRKGVVGDYAQHLTEEHWKQMDRWFVERLQGVEIAEPLMKYMVSGEGSVGDSSVMDH
mmetsp:Transcript_19002/g.25519  ORF Transcript_19002/g.25519 Transcript_19002/m.25519 type:complete len:83 (-) Transcript_19002:93-341(-)